MDLLENLLKIGGITALSIGVLYLLYRQLISLGIFPKLTSRQTFLLLMAMVVLIFLVVAMAFFSTSGNGLAGIFEENQPSIDNQIASGGGSTNTNINCPTEPANGESATSITNTISSGADSINTNANGGTQENACEPSQ